MSYVNRGSGNGPTALVDTSIAFPTLRQQHDNHELALAAVIEHQAGIAAHSLFETYAILTRHPELRVSPSSALALIDRRFKHRAVLSSAATNRALKAIAAGDIRGGATYDALIGATAAEAGLPLLTFDRRAQRTYEAVGVEVRYLA
ncbi:MAG TPA: PIN domain-containing protein [Acidimicrobiales bacterium]|nr:PIN domain-containing protein [Acidimicrobiales bacterium]